MADKISASITYVDTANNKGTKAITDISPSADNGAIKNFCVGLLGLTNNTLSQIDRVEKTDITNAAAKQDLEVTFANIPLMRQNLRLGGKSENTNSHFLQFLVINPAQAYPVKINYETVNNTNKPEITKIDFKPVYMPGLPAAGDLHALWDFTAFEGATGNIEITLKFFETLKTNETKYKVTITTDAPTLEKITQ